MADYAQWEKERPALNDAFVDGAGPGVNAGMGLGNQDIVFEDHFGQYGSQVAAEVNWAIDGAEWTFDPLLDRWNVSGAQAVATKCARIATGVGAGEDIEITVVVDTLSVGAIEVRYDAQVALTGIVAPGTYTATLTATAGDGTLTVEGDAAAVGSFGYARVSRDNAYGAFRAANAGAITVA